MAPRFWQFLIRCIEQWTRTFCKKKRKTGPVRNRSTGVNFEIYRLGRVEKILTGSIFASILYLVLGYQFIPKRQRKKSLMIDSYLSFFPRKRDNNWMALKFVLAALDGDITASI